MSVSGLNPVPRSLRDRISEHRTLLTVIAVAELIVITLVSTIDEHSHIDGEVYQLGGKAWLMGRDLYDNLPATESGLELPFIYPPFAAIVFTPLAVVPKPVAIIFLTILTHVTLLITLYAVLSASNFLKAHRHKTLLVTAAVLPLATILEPVEQTIGYSQINVALMAMVAVDCLWRVDGDRKLPYPRGVLIGLAAAIKLTPLAFLLFFLLRKDYRSIVVSLVTCLGTMVVGLALAFDDSVKFWLQGEMFASSSMSFGKKFVGDTSTYPGNQSLRSLLSKLHLPEWGMTLIWVLLVLVVLAIAVAGIMHALRQNDLPMALTINAIAGLLISPISWSNHWVWVAPGLALLIGTAYTRRDWPLLMMTTMGAGFFVMGPHWRMPQGKGREMHWNFFQHVVGNSYVLWALAFLFYGAYGWWQYRRMTRTSAPASRGGDEIGAPVS